MLLNSVSVFSGVAHPVYSCHFQSHSRGIGARNLLKVNGY